MRTAKGNCKSCSDKHDMMIERDLSRSLKTKVHLGGSNSALFVDRFLRPRHDGVDVSADNGFTELITGKSFRW